MLVSEQFYSIQGEGSTAGIPSYFLRLAKCNLMCGGAGTQKDGKLHNGATWRCDTIEVWMKGVEKTREQVIEDFGENFIKDLATKKAHLVITGGEPLMHQKQIADLMEAINIMTHFRTFLEIETNGTLVPEDTMCSIVTQWNVSPKLANSGMRYEVRYNPTALIKLSRMRSIFKFVVAKETDLDEIEETFLLDQVVDRNAIYLMPAVDNLADYPKIMNWLAEVCKKRRYKMTGRLQVQLWDKTTGV